MSHNIPAPAPGEIERAIWPADAFQKQADNTFQMRFNALLDCTGATYRQIERGTRGVVRQQNVWQFRTGRARNPSYKVLAALSHFFNIPVSYFFDDTCDGEIAYLLPCLPQAERKQIERMVTELLEHQLLQFGRQLREQDRLVSQQNDRP